MNPVERAVRAVDRFQQRHTSAGFVVAVVRKFGDDRGGTLATSLAFNGVVAVFPLLLLLTTILGFVLGRSEAAEEAVRRSALVEFPIVGNEIVRSLRPLRGSGIAVAVGIVGLAWGGVGLTQAAQHAMAEIWNVPGVRRPGFLPRMARSAAVLAVGGVGVMASSALAAVPTFTGHLTVERLVSTGASMVLNALLFLAAFRMTTVRKVPTRQLVPGAVVGGIAWSLLQALGGYLVGHQLRNASEVYGFFATVLGLMSWVFLAARVVLYAAEMNVVLARRSWPRSIVQPPLTEADKQVLADIVRQEERRPEETVHVSFEDDETDHPPTHHRPDPDSGPQ